MADVINWDSFTLFLYITARMSGFVLFNPLLGRSSIPAYFKTGFILLLSFSAASSYTGMAQAPGTILELMVKLLLELGLGFLVGVVMNIFFYIPAQAGTAMDEQMGLSMAQTYNPSFQGNLTPSASLLNVFAMLLFFTANGHYTLLRLMLTSGDLVPFGSASLGEAAAERVVELFVDCVLLAVKLCLPILASEFMGQVGMGILMKVIPQINVFAINIELKVLVGMVILFLLISPFSEYLLGVETTMLSEIERALAQVAGPAG